MDIFINVRFVKGVQLVFISLICMHNKLSFKLKETVDFKDDFYQEQWSHFCILKKEQNDKAIPKTDTAHSLPQTLSPICMPDDF